MSAPRVVDVFRAQGVLFDAEDAVEQVTIRIHDEMPDVEPDRARAHFASQGAALAEAIWASCPGGTVDAVISALLARRASSLRVPFGEVRS